MCVREVGTTYRSGNMLEEHPPIHLATEVYQLCPAIIGVMVDR
jgi:hypothetical protein